MKNVLNALFWNFFAAKAQSSIKLKEAFYTSPIFTLLIFFTLFIPSILLFAQPSAPNDKTFADEKIQWIENTIDTYMEENNIPALVVGIIKDGQVEAYISKGHLKRGSKQPVNENTVFQLASLTKSFTGIITNNLVAEGKLDINKSITTYLPENLPVQTIQKLSPITIRDVLHHRSGLPRNAQNEPPTPWGKPLKAADYGEAELLENLNLLEIQFEPDSSWAYSNFGYSLIGYILERASGKTYEELLQKYVGNQFGMQSTTTVLAKAKAKGLAQPYRTDLRSWKTKPWEFGKLVAAGGAFSTVADLSRLMIQQMEDYESFQISGDATPLVLTKHKKSMSSLGNMFYGFGFMETRSTIDTTIFHLGHGGDVDGFVSNYSFAPARKTGLVMLSSSGGGWFWELERIIMQKVLDMPMREEVKVEKHILKNYIGKYQFESGTELEIMLKGDQLWSKVPGAPRHRLYSEGENKLFYKAFDAQFEFILDEQGQVAKTIYHQNGKTTNPRKIK